MSRSTNVESERGPGHSFRLDRWRTDAVCTECAACSGCPPSPGHAVRFHSTSIRPQGRGRVHRPIKKVHEIRGENASSVCRTRNSRSAGWNVALHAWVREHTENKGRDLFGSPPDGLSEDHRRDAANSTIPPRGHGVCAPAVSHSGRGEGRPSALTHARVVSAVATSVDFPRPSSSSRQIS